MAAKIKEGNAKKFAQNLITQRAERTERTESSEPRTASKRYAQQSLLSNSSASFVYAYFSQGCTLTAAAGAAGVAAAALDIVVVIAATVVQTLRPMP